LEQTIVKLEQAIVKLEQAIVKLEQVIVKLFMHTKDHIKFGLGLHFMVFRECLFEL